MENKDNYLELKHYNSAARSESDSEFCVFEQEGFYYFGYLDSSGKCVLRSQGYQSALARDNGIASVKKNHLEKARYNLQEKDGKWYVGLKAANHQEIALSGAYSSKSEAESAAAIMRGEKAQVASGTGKDEYLSAEKYEGHARAAAESSYSSFSHDGEHYFALLNDKGKVLLRSQGYKSTAARDNGIASVENNRSNRDRFVLVERDGSWFISLKAGNHQEIALSSPYRNEGMAKGALASMMAGISGSSGLLSQTETKSETIVDEVKGEADEKLKAGLAAAGVGSVVGSGIVSKSSEESGEESGKSTESDAADEHKEDVYQAASFYANRKINDKTNHVAMFKDGDLYYFALFHPDGSLRIRSEGFQTAKDRDQELSGVLRFKDDKDRYETIERAGRYIHILKDETGREVGRSGYSTEANPLAILSAKAESTVEKTEQNVETKIVEKSKEVSSIESSEESGSDSSKLAAGLAATGGVVAGSSLVSKSSEESKEETSNQESSSTETSGGEEEHRDDVYLDCASYGNRNINDKVNNVAHFKEGDLYYFALYHDDGSVRLRSEGFQTAKDRDQELSGVLRFRDDASRYETMKRAGKYIHILKDETGREVGRSCYTSDVNPVPVVAPPQVVESKVEEKIEVKEEVKEVEASDSKAGLAAGIMTTGAVIAGAGSLKGEEEMVEEKVEEIVEKTVVEETVIEKKTEVIKETVKKDPPKETYKEDVYLACKAYKGYKVSDKKNNVSMFKAKGKYYFALYNSDGSVRLRSEGFKQSNRRDQELAGVLKLKDVKEQYETIQQGGKYIHVLKDKSGNEIARSCLVSNAVPFIATSSTAKVAAVGAAATVATAAAATTMKKEEPAPVKKVAPVEKAAVKKVAPVATTTTAPVAATGGGFKWWWLLPLLLLIPIYFGWQTCNKAAVAPAVKTTAAADKAAKEKAAKAKKLADEKAAAAAAAAKKEAEKAKEVAAVKETKEEPKKEVKKETPPPVTDKSCNCSGQRHKVFKVPSGPAPKALTKLGLFPEFGDSHALDPAGFYNKLKERHRSNATDRNFLDAVFKAMGYTGFKDAKPGLFTNVTIKSGITANIGGGPNHKTYHRKLNLKGKDLKAFKIKAANGCDLHFMKTCGNHMFYCPN